MNFTKNFVIDIECDYHKILIEYNQFQLRYLQTLNSISAEHNSTIIFPVPIGMMWDINDKGKKYFGYGWWRDDNYNHYDSQCPKVWCELLMIREKIFRPRVMTGGILQLLWLPVPISMVLDIHTKGKRLLAFMNIISWTMTWRRLWLWLCWCWCDVVGDNDDFNDDVDDDDRCDKKGAFPDIMSQLLQTSPPPQPQPPVNNK